MLDQSPELGKNVQATCCGTWDTAIIAGLDERGEQPAPFLNIIMEPMAGGYGARPHADGLDTGGLFCIPMGGPETPTASGSSWSRSPSATRWAETPCRRTARAPARSG